MFSSCSLLNKEDKKNDLSVLPETKINEKIFNEDFSVDTSTWSISKFIDIKMLWNWLSEDRFEIVESSYNDLVSWTLLDYERLLVNDYEYFKENDWEELEFFYIFRNYVFWDNYEVSTDINDLFLCLDWKKKYQELDSFYSQICKWENKYIQENDENFYWIKDSIITFKKIYSWDDISCDYFLNTQYDYDPKYYHSLKFNDYIFCNKLKDLENYSIPNAVFFYNTAVESEVCSILLDDNLKKLCEDELENNY